MNAPFDAQLPKGPIAVIGNHPPRRCGIATFTQDLRTALNARASDPSCLAVAMTDAHGPYDYGDAVALEIAQDDPASYIAAAEHLNRAQVSAVVLQHEFGIFGGPAGDYILTLLRHLRAPLVTTLHTVLTHPDTDQRRVMEALIARSYRLVVMAEKGREILGDTYGVPASKIELIPHGIPNEPLIDMLDAKAKLNVDGRKLLLTFGLLSPNKGIEVMIEAMPEIVQAHPDALYLVVGATHPNLKRHEGERYRDSLRHRAAALGVAAHIGFVDGFLELEDLLDYVAAADIYVTPYLNEAQITSGTLAYAVGLGKPVVSTPYWYAQELLGGERGVIVPFAQVNALAEAIKRLLGSAPLRAQLKERSLAAGREMRWSAVARRYHDLLAKAATRHLSRGGALAAPLPQFQSRGPRPERSGSVRDATVSPLRPLCSVG